MEQQTDEGPCDCTFPPPEVKLLQPHGSLSDNCCRTPNESCGEEVCVLGVSLASGSMTVLVFAVNVAEKHLGSLSCCASVKLAIAICAAAKLLN